MKNRRPLQALASRFRKQDTDKKDGHKDAVAQAKPAPLAVSGVWSKLFPKIFLDMEILIVVLYRMRYCGNVYSLPSSR